ncbi:mitochondrial carrier domain-containing protein [Chytriomyces sp. MP71]|nr:mitochondrial carrier domain-containing protein [Chytriomyces sp. MP71]
MSSDPKGNFVFGACGGICNVLVSHPFDLVKVRLQSPQFGYRNSFHAISYILRSDGPLGMYRGVSPVLLGAGPIMGCCYLSYSTALAFAHTSVHGSTPVPEGVRVVDTLPIQYVALAGACAAIPTSLIMGPAERIKILIQVQTKSTSTFKGPAAIFNPLASIWTAIISNGGFKTLFRGTALTMMRDFPGYAAYFATFEGVKRLLKEHAPVPRHAWGSDKYNFSPLQTVFAGGLSGCACWLVCIPIDSIKTQVQQSNGATVLSVLRNQTSLFKLYRGLGPVLIRAFPSSGAFFLGVETARAVYESSS